MRQLGGRACATASEPTTQTSGAEIEFLLRFARAAHDAGYTTAELEERMTALARRLGLSNPEVSATPTEIELAVGALPHQRSYTLRVRPGSVDLGAIAELDGLVASMLELDLDGLQALEHLHEITQAHRTRPRLVVFASYGLLAAALTPTIGGGWHEVVAAGLVGLLVAAVTLPPSRRAEVGPISAPLGAIVASFAAQVLAQLGLAAAPDVVTLAALIPLLPGMTLSVGVRELASGQLQSGVANTADALIQLLGLVFGVEIGRSIAISWFGLASEGAPHAASLAIQVGGAVVAGLAFTIRLRGLARDAALMCTACVVALLANEVGRHLLGPKAGVFGAALVLGIVGGLVGRHLGRSPLVFIVPGVFLLVPGSSGFRSALHLLTGEPVSGVTAAFDTFVTAISIAYGLMISAVIVPQDVRRLASARASAGAASRGPRP